jgi:hypothetical protein
VDASCLNVTNYMNRLWTCKNLRKRTVNAYLYILLAWLLAPVLR